MKHDDGRSESAWVHLACCLGGNAELSFRSNRRNGELDRGVLHLLTPWRCDAMARARERQQSLSRLCTAVRRSTLNPALAQGTDGLA